MAKSRNTVKKEYADLIVKKMHIYPAGSELEKLIIKDLQKLRLDTLMTLSHKLPTSKK